MPTARPNLLLIITDQQRADHVGFGGNDIVRTPHLDALGHTTYIRSAWIGGDAQ
jgi:arylsulfatase A-like enzyme